MNLDVQNATPSTSREKITGNNKRLVIIFINTYQKKNIYNNFFAMFGKYLNIVIKITF